MSLVKNREDAAKIVKLIDSGQLSKEGTERAMVDLKEFHRLNKPSSALQQAEATAKGFNVGVIAKTLGIPVDALSAVARGADYGLEALGVPEDFIEIPPDFRGGSKSIARTLEAGGMGYTDLSDLPIDQRAFARGGQTVGEVTGMAAVPFAAARGLTPAQALIQKTLNYTPANTIKQVASEMVKSTARNPGKMATIEGTSALGAGAARTVSETLLPGNEVAGMLSELIGGVTGPAPGLRYAANKVKGIADTFLPSGRQRAASEKTIDILKQQNPDITDEQISGIAKQLKDAEGPGRTAQITEDAGVRKTFTAMDNKLLADAGDEAKSAMMNQNKKTIDAFERKIRKLQNSGDPELVREAAQLRLDVFTNNMQTRVQNAEARMGEAVAKVLNKNSDDAVSASREARKIIDGELEKARQKETQLWGEVDKSVTIPNLGMGTIKRTDKIKAEMLPEEKLPAPIEAFVNRLRRNEKVGKDAEPYFQRQSDLQPTPRSIERPSPISAKDLFRARSRALEMGREAKAKMKFGEARRMNEIADAMLDDLMTVSDETTTVARKFSRELHERFNTKLIQGMQKVEPELALATGMGMANDTQRALNMQAMKRATESSEAKDALARLQKEFSQAGAAKVINPLTGKVKPGELATFIKKNPQTLREAGLINDVNNMNEKVRLAGVLQNTFQRGQAHIDKKSLVSKIIDKDGTKGGLNAVIDRAFNSKFQGEAFRDLTNMVKRAKSPDAMEGLRHAVFESLIQKSKIKKGDLDGLISGKQLEQLLSSKVGDKTLRQNLLSSKLVTPEQLTQVSQVARKARIFEEAATDPAKLNQVLSSADGLIDVLARIGGSAMGSMTALAKNSGLVMSAAGSRIARKNIVNAPQLKIQGVLTKAMEDPKFMAMLLEMGPKAPKQVNTRINAYLLQAGLLED
jgi:hypothetical protein